MLFTGAWYVSTFQFHYGSIDTIDAKELIVIAAVFQFHYGSIDTKFPPLL